MVFLYSTSNSMLELPSQRPLATFRLRRNVAAKFAARFLVFFQIIAFFSRNFFIFKANLCRIDQQGFYLFSHKVNLQRPLTPGFSLI